MPPATAVAATGLERVGPDMSLLKWSPVGGRPVWGVGTGVSGQTPVCPGWRHVFTLEPAVRTTQ
ncbi:hypothetical protein SMCF_3071 [Streptomyces coelicoflavus ZG0656]|nr:hypothetical protein SMCF_3071 [Streptomyces coelicoflavus ZG0656]